jgi:hypothetical protein
MLWVLRCEDIPVSPLVDWRSWWSAEGIYSLMWALNQWGGGIPSIQYIPKVVEIVSIEKSVHRCDQWLNVTPPGLLKMFVMTLKYGPHFKCWGVCAMKKKIIFYKYLETESEDFIFSKFWVCDNVSSGCNTFHTHILFTLGCFFPTPCSVFWGIFSFSGRNLSEVMVLHNSVQSKLQ